MVFFFIPNLAKDIVLPPGAEQSIIIYLVIGGVVVLGTIHLINKI